MAHVCIHIQNTIAWLKRDGDCSPCKSCGDNIYGNKYSPLVTLSISDVVIEVAELDVDICESCHDALIDII